MTGTSPVTEPTPVSEMTAPVESSATADSLLNTPLVEAKPAGETPGSAAEVIEVAPEPASSEPAPAETAEVVETMPVEPPSPAPVVATTPEAAPEAPKENGFRAFIRKVFGV